MKRGLYQVYQEKIHARHLNPYAGQISSIFRDQLVTIIKLFGRAGVREGYVY